MPVEKKQPINKADKPKTKVVEQDHEVAEEQPAAPSGGEFTRPLDEFLGRAQKAYITYLEAQKDVWKAFNETQQRVEDDYRAIEQEANRERDEAVEHYLVIRSEAETEAERTYQEALAQVQQAYADAKEEAKRSSEEGLRQALDSYKDTIQRARTEREESIERARRIFS